MKHLLLLLIAFACVQVHGQFEYKTGHTELVRFNGERKLAGWHVEPGLTWMYTRPKDYSDRIDFGDSAYLANWDPGGKFRAYLGAGRYHILPYMRFLHFIDYGLGWKWLAGKETYEGTMNNLQDGTSALIHEGDGKFSSHHLLAYFNANNLWQISDNHFIQNSLGINFDWRFLGSSPYNGNTSPFHQQEDPARFKLQLHYKFGFGIKINDGFFIIPAVETPILNFIPWNNGRSQLDIFNSRYRPFIFTIRFAWLGKNQTVCKVPGMSDDERKKQEQFFQQR